MWFRIVMAGFVSLATMGGLYAVLFDLVKATVETPGVIIVHKIEFTPMKRDSTVADVRRTKPERKQTVTPPNMPPIAIAAPNTPTSDRPMIDTVPVGAGGIKIERRELGNVGGIDTEVIPLVRIQPQYPARAAAGNIEGWVRCQFTITPAGGVVDAIVTDSEPRGVFDRAALEAVSRWKYKPKVDGGVAVERRGVQVLLSFQLEK
jgi:periplasmic protein TonB